MRYAWWAAAFLLCDVLIAAALIMLLVARERAVRAMEWMFPVRGRWLYYLLITLTILGYAALSPVFLFFLITMKR